MALRRYSILGATLALFCFFCSFTQLVSGQSQITQPAEVTALKAIYGGLKDPFKKLRNWKDSSDPCSSNWTGVICSSDRNDGYLHVIELRLLNRNLTGTIDPQIGRLSNLTIINFMWNDISGSIPKEIGSLTLLRLLLLTGNQLSGVLPDELGNLTNLRRLQVDLNNISGPLPKSFANLSKVLHFHMNNNSISGQIPVELSVLPELVHFLLDNNNLSGSLPPELSQMPRLRIIQLDNNNFEGSEIPVSYANMSTLLKLSLRNCNLRGSIPDFSAVPKLLYLDLSSNQLTGSIPTNKLSNIITTIDLSNNMLGGTIPSNFSGLRRLQKLILEGNTLTGNVPSSIWENMTFNDDNRLILNFKHNLLSILSRNLNPPPNVTVELKGNPVCDRAKALNIVQFCEIEDVDPETALPPNTSASSATCPPHACPTALSFEYVPSSPVDCFCAAPLTVGILLRSPSMSEFRAYIDQFQEYITLNLGLRLYQLFVDSFVWQEGPRVSVYAKLFPSFDNKSQIFNTSEIQRLRDQFATLSIPLNDTFGPYDLIDFILPGPYEDVVLKPLHSGMSKGALAGIVLAAIAGGTLLLFTAALVLRKTHLGLFRRVPENPLITEVVKRFRFAELESATNGFDDDSEIGRGGYGKVYKGVLSDGNTVAVKRAQRASLQTEKEFVTEINILSRVHHRNLVSLVGYCDEQGEQMLAYEFMPMGSLHGRLSDRLQSPLSFAMRLSIALDASRGILYLHTEASPPIIHRDIKPNNILLDSGLTAKVSDFGISRLALVPDGTGPPTNLRGTFGYIDPEYVRTQEPTAKTDVYSLGIVFLQLLTGLPVISHGIHIVAQVVNACESGRMSSIIDENMDSSSYSSECGKRFMRLALKCSQDGPNGRPFMSEIVRELEDIRSMFHNNNNDASQGLLFSASSSTNTTFNNNYHSSNSEILSTPPLYSERNLDVSSDYYRGSNLVSGVIPTIKPR